MKLLRLVPVAFKDRLATLNCVDISVKMTLTAQIEKKSHLLQTSCKHAKHKKGAARMNARNAYRQYMNEYRVRRWAQCIASGTCPLPRQTLPRHILFRGEEQIDGNLQPDLLSYCPVRRRRRLSSVQSFIHAALMPASLNRTSETSACSLSAWDARPTRDFPLPHYVPVHDGP